MNGSQSATRVRPKSVSFSLLHLVSTGVAQGSPVMLNIPSHCSRWLAAESLAGLLVVAGGQGVALFLSTWISLQGFLGFITAQTLSTKKDCSKKPRRKLQDFLWAGLTSLSKTPLPHWSSKALRLLRFKERTESLNGRSNKDFEGIFNLPRPVSIQVLLNLFWSVLVTQSCPTLCNPLDCSPPGSSVRGLLQARILEWVAMPSSTGSSQPRNWTQASYGFFTIWISRKSWEYWSG